MPKIFGEVIKPNQKLVCRNCGYAWNPTPTNKLDLDKNYRITCPVCRLLKGKSLFHEIVIGKDRYRILSNRILKLPYDKLMADDYLSIDIDILHINCGSHFRVKAMDLDNISCPKCYPKKPEYDKQSFNRDKTIGINNEVQEVKKKEPENIENIASPIIDDEPKIEQTKPEKTDGTKANKSKIKKIIKDMAGKVYHKQMMIIGTDDKDQCICQCIHCGVENHIPISQILNKARRDRVFRCNTCQDNFKNENSYIDRLVGKYIGKVFNGLMITDIYSDEDGVTRCNCVCLRSRSEKDLNKFEHNLEGLSLGEVINSKANCKECSNGIHRDNILFSVLGDGAGCSRFLDKNRQNRFDKIGYNIDRKKQLTLEKLYTTDGKLCDYCALQGKCDARYAGLIDFNEIKYLADYKTNAQVSASDVHAKYPSIYSSMDKDAREVKLLRDKDLQVFRDAYIGRDGKIYKFCKCITHRTELILSENEIANFDHHQCTTGCNSNFRFFNIDSRYLLNNSDK